MSIRSPARWRAARAASPPGTSPPGTSPPGTSPPGTSPRYPLAATRRLTVDTVARRGGLHPDLVRRFVALGLLDGSRDATGMLWLAPDSPARIARIQRLRAGLCLNYAAIGLVMDLLERIDALETALRAGPSARPSAGPPGRQPTAPP
jgi:chaperone modulatory protein CbpM